MHIIDPDYASPPDRLSIRGPLWRGSVPAPEMQKALRKAPTRARSQCTLLQCVKLAFSMERVPPVCRGTEKREDRTVHWSRDFDIHTVPDDVLFAESSRRMRARQKTPPRREVLRPCPRCGELYGARKLRSHLPGCAGTAADRYLNRNRMIRKITNTADQDAENYRYWQSRPIGERLAAVCEVSEAAFSIQKVR
jgi:hypothetical protein